MVCRANRLVMTPREIVRSHALTYLAGHAALFAWLFFAEREAT